MIVFLVLLVMIVIPIVVVLLQYNELVSLRNHIHNAWSHIDTELQRRYDLIPNLVATVKGYATHEREVLERVVALRNQCAANHGSVASQSRDETELVAVLQRLFVLVEQYPQLKADSHFLQLQQELINTEDRIQAARRFFNGNVRDYKTKCQVFPSNIVASIFGFRDEDYFQVSPSVREVPDVKF
ncbi:MAG: LemA family protein [Planctomycetaceae bacterium]|nr:LemA family protein [Planctomycetaceae bacterium]